MAEIVDVAAISVVIASASVVAGVVHYAFQIRHQAKIRQTDLVMRLYSTFSSKEFQDAWTKVRSSDFEGPKDVHEYDQKHGLAEVNQVCLFCEGIGILLHRKLADTRMIEDLFGGAIARAWEKVRTGVITARRQLNDPTIYEYFEYLYNETKKAPKASNES